jgi:HK97 family phage portal protein
MNMLAPFRRALTAFTAKGDISIGETVIPSGGRWQRIVERRPGEWQRRIRADREDILQVPAAFAAQGLISQDFAKLTARLLKWNAAAEVYERASLSYVDDLLVRPNAFQNILQFNESWMQSKLSSGNTYALKGRLQGSVRALYILDPWRTKPMVSPSGSVFYALYPDNLAGLEEATIVPASEIIHDRFNTLYHPLVGVSPLHPASLIASLGIEIQERAARFWKNNAQPGGALVIPDSVDEDKIELYKRLWSENYGGENYGKTAVLAGGMDYKPFSQTAKDSQLVEQLKLTREEIATCYRVPLYKLNAASTPAAANGGQLDQEYYSQCQQTHVVNYEMAMTLGLELPKGYKVDLDEGDMLRMDPLTKAKVMKERVTGGWWTLNEARREDNKPPKAGGDDLLVQEQYWPSAAVADPSRGVPKKSGGAAPSPANDDNNDDDATERALAAFSKGLLS